MSIVHVVGKGGVSGANRTLFVGPRTPDEIKKMIKPLKQIDKQTLRKLLHVIVACLEGKEVPDNALTSLQSPSLNEETLAFIYAGLHKLLKCALRVPASLMKQDQFREDLQELHIPADFIPDIASVVYGSSVLNRVLQPTVFVEMTTSDGKINTFEVPMAEFHKLRYSVAAVLKEMEDVEKRSILKIQA